MADGWRWKSGRAEKSCWERECVCGGAGDEGQAKLREVESGRGSVEEDQAAKYKA